MKIPVIIAAHNEEVLLPRALDSLPNDLVEPIVIPNGCDDRTETIAREAGATVLPLPEPSKMRAIQEGIQFLGSRAVDPFLLLDADSALAFPRRWANSMQEAAKTVGDRPAVVHGPLWYVDGPGLAANTVRNLRFTIHYVRHCHDDSRGQFPGANVFIHPKSEGVVRGLLELDDFWPGEDTAIKDVIVRAGGKSYKTVRPSAMVVTDAARHAPLRDVLLKGRARTRGAVYESYLRQQPVGARRYQPMIK